MKFPKIVIALLILSGLVASANQGLAASTEATSAPTSASAPSSSATTYPTSSAFDAPKVRWLVPPDVAVRKINIGSLDRANSGYLFQIEAITTGGSINTIKLADYFMSVQDKQLFKKAGSEEVYEQEAAQDPKTYQGHYSLLNPVNYGDAHYLPTETRSIKLSASGQEIPEFVPKDDQWEVVPSPTSAPADTQSVSLAWTLKRGLPDGSQQPFVRIVKTYRVKKSDYSITMELRIENLSGQPISGELDQGGPCGVPEESYSRSDSRESILGKLLPADKTVEPIRKALKDVQAVKIGSYEKLGKTDDGQPLVWIGQVNKYFGAILHPVGPSQDRLDAPDDKATMYLVASPESATSRVFITGMLLPFKDLKPGVENARTWTFDLFAGPKDRDLLEGKGPLGKDLYRDLNYKSAIDLTSGGCGLCTFSWLTYGMLYLLDVFGKVAFGNYGVAIIILVVLTRLALHPLTKKGQVSMSRMQKMAPEMNKLKEKYADDKEALNREMMKLYKTQGPAGMLGCLPMMLQMPIWIALYSALGNAIELRHAAFLPWWITDLAAPDALVSFAHPVTIPLVSLLMGPIASLNLLPLLVAVSMFLQSKFTPQMTASASPDAAKQQKLMLWMMPFMMLFIFYSLPSGLNLYVMASTFAGVGEQYIIRKHIREREQLEAQTVVSVPGKGLRSSRPKKPKGPFWTKRG